jgi:inorganic pyrophosphatase
MKKAIKQLPPFDPEKKLLNVVIETPKGSRNKYAFDEAAGLFELRKILPLGMSFPFDFGFVPATRGEDGDPLDVLLLMEEKAFPGCLVRSQLLGVMRAEQIEDGKKTRNDRLIAIAAVHSRVLQCGSLKEVDPKLLEEVQEFFTSYNRLEGKKFKVLGIDGKKAAVKLVERAARAGAAPPTEK